MTEPKRVAVGSCYATRVYPKWPKSANPKTVDIVLSDDEALNLARHLVQAARVTKELTIAARREPSVKKRNHLVTVTYEPRKKK